MRALAAGAMLIALAGVAIIAVPSTLAVGNRASVLCNGVEQWKIKTLADEDAGDVNLDPSAIKHLSVKTLRKFKKPAGAGEGRIPPVETTVYEVKAALIKARWVWDPSPSTPDKKRGDRDIHLVIAAWPWNHAGLPRLRGSRWAVLGSNH